MGFVKTFIATTLLAVIGYYAYQQILFLKPWRSILEHTPGPCFKVDIAEEGSEDFAVLPNGNVLITAGLRFGPVPDHRKGRIYLFDFNRPNATVELAIKWKDAAKFSKFNPHGIDALELESGQIIVFVVNHDPHEAIERFSLDLSKKTLTHLESILDPTLMFMNSVVATGERQFYATNSQMFKHGVVHEWELILASLGSLAYYDGTAGQLLRSGYYIPNGLALSRDKTKLYLAHFGHLSLETYDITDRANFSLVHTVNLDTAPDNIQVDPDDGSIWLACDPSVWQFLVYAADPLHTKAPSQVLKVEVNQQGLPDGEITEVYMDDGSQISASAVAMRHKRKLLIGSVLHSLVMCDINV